MTAVKLYDFDELDSTNRYARAEFAALPDGALVVADRQSAGRGRLGRRWHSAPGEGIYASLVMKHCADPFVATMVLSLGALDMLRETAPEVPVWLKWPNDLYVADRKLAGVLTESCLGVGNRFEGVVAGIGINVNQNREALAAIDLPATSLNFEVGREFPVKKMVSRLVETLNWRYSKLLNHAPEIFAEWRSANRLIGCEVELADAQGARKGRILDITSEGHLLFRGDDGKTMEWSAGDVRIARESLSRVIHG